MESQYQGTIGDKLPLELEVIAVRTVLNAAYGDATLFEMKDKEGNLFSKFGIIPERFIVSNHKEVKEGTVVRFNATVKQHKEYKGVKITVLSTIVSTNSVHFCVHRIKKALRGFLFNLIA